MSRVLRRYQEYLKVQIAKFSPESKDWRKNPSAETVLLEMKLESRRFEANNARQWWKKIFGLGGKR